MASSSQPRGKETAKEGGRNKRPRINLTPSGQSKFDKRATILLPNGRERKLTEEWAFTQYFQLPQCSTYFPEEIAFLGWNRLFYTTETSYRPVSAGMFYEMLRKDKKTDFYYHFFHPVNGEKIELTEELISRAIGVPVRSQNHQDPHQTIQRIGLRVAPQARTSTRGDSYLLSTFHRNQIAVVDWLQRNVFGSLANVMKKQMVILDILQSRYELRNGRMERKNELPEYCICRSLLDTITDAISGAGHGIKLPVVVTRILEILEIPLDGEVRFCREYELHSAITSNTIGDWTLDTPVRRAEEVRFRGFAEGQRDPFEALAREPATSFPQLQQSVLDTGILLRDYQQQHFLAFQDRMATQDQRITALGDQQTAMAAQMETHQAAQIAEHRRTRGLLAQLLSCFRSGGDLPPDV